ncbi:MAG: peroxiredoxin [Planctomycetota bacterium]
MRLLILSLAAALVVACASEPRRDRAAEPTSAGTGTSSTGNGTATNGNGTSRVEGGAPAAGTPTGARPTRPLDGGATFSDVRVSVPKDAAIVEAAAAERSPLRGETAPAFALMDQDGNEFTLASMRGNWVVVYFYPRDDTPGCTCQATEFTEVVKEYARRGAPVVGISPDSRESHRAFVEKYGLRLTLLSDPELDVARRFGSTRVWTLSSGTLETVVRSTALIDPEGRIAWHWPEVVPEGHAQRVLAKLDELTTPK